MNIAWTSENLLNEVDSVKSGYKTVRDASATL